jgi:hypothetical protein
MFLVRRPHLYLAILSVAFINTSVALAAEEEDEDEPKVAPGLVAAFAQATCPVGRPYASTMKSTQRRPA